MKERNKRTEKRGGKDEEKRNIAKKLLKQKVSIEIIKLSTGLAEEEIQKLA